MTPADDALTPAEAEAARLLSGLRSAPSPGSTDLAASIARSARWQRTARHTVLSLSTAIGSFAGGLGSLIRRGR